MTIGKSETSPAARPLPSSAAEPGETPDHARKSSLAVLALGALGVVYGDIGTSPLYTVNEVFAGTGTHSADPRPRDRRDFGHLLVADDRRVAEVRDADPARRQPRRGRHHGAVRARHQRGRQQAADPSRDHRLPALFGAALFYGDGVITPAISVLSAVEGLEIATPALKHVVVPVTVAVLVVLFVVQRNGTAGIGALFGPIMLRLVSGAGAGSASATSSARRRSCGR